MKTEGFTPMSLSRSGADLEICAYSGCWRGPVLVRRTRGSIDLLYAGTGWVEPETDRPAPPSEPLAIIYNRKSKTVLMDWFGFSNVMSCG